MDRNRTRGKEIGEEIRSRNGIGIRSKNIRGIRNGLEVKDGTGLNSTPLLQPSPYEASCGGENCLSESRFLGWSEDKFE